MPTGLRRRQIGPDDLEAVASFLAGGFRLRPPAYWRRGLERQAARAVRPGRPRFGYMLEKDGQVVGTILVIAAELEHEGREFERCALSSWYVAPEVRAQAPLLVSPLLGDPALSLLNISAAPNTWPTVGAQGFAGRRAPKRLTVPALAPRVPGAAVRLFRGPDDPAALGEGERRLLADHAGFGCLCLVVETHDGPQPFAFAQGRVLRRLVPTLRLVWCRDIAAYARLAGTIGRFLLGRGALTVTADEDPSVAQLPGWRIAPESRSYARGPLPFRPGDLAYTEVVLYGL
ncbi:MAG: hypothetical protein JO048_04670 [Methylobacteriaceae bacterium]|nr:hypothetical protein [Methylobacteriaceae bacterium]